MRFACKPTGRRRQVWRDKRHSLSGKAAERTLIAAMARPVTVDGRFVVVDLDAELGGVAKERLKLGRDRRVIGASESRRSKSGRRRGGEKLNDERKRDDERRWWRSERRQGALRAPLPKRKCPATDRKSTRLNSSHV